MRKLLSMLTVIVLISVLFSTITLNVSAAGSNVYEFEVKTKNVAYAGTDAKISYKLVGDKGETDWVVSNGAINGNAYVQNRVDKFELTFSKEVGTVQKLLIKSNQQWASPDWQCEYVIVKQKDTDKSYSFVIDEWFNNKNEHEY
ncbi:MAG: PLAT/LH2 domain-containing protein, partial [Oscillospiraceae bacterium]